MSGDDAGLRELMQTKFAHMEARLDDLKRTFEKAMEATARADRLESAMLKIHDLQATTRRLDSRLDETEGQVKIYKYIGGLVAIIVVAIAIAWLQGMLGI